MSSPPYKISPHQRKVEQPKYLFRNPELHLTKEMRQWLSQSRIVHISPLWLPLPRKGRFYGGAEDVVYNNIISLEKLGAKSQVIFGHPLNLVLEDQIMGASVEIPEGSEPTEDLLYLLRTDRETAERRERNYVLEAYNKIRKKAGRCSIVHDHTNYGRDHGDWLSETVLPVVRTEHGPLTQPYTSEEEEANLRHFVGRESMGFIAISENQKNHIPDLNWVGVNYNGVNLEEFEFNEKKEKFLLFLGRLAPTKGAHNAIELSKRVGLPLVIAGAVEEVEESLKYFEERIRPHIDGRKVFHITKGVNSAQRKELLSKTQALLMLIEWDEPFGMVMAEAMASGTPIIGFPKGSIPEIVTEGTGFVVNNMDEAENAVDELLRKNYSPRDSRARAEEYFSKEAMAIRNISIYMEQEKKFLKRLS